MNNPVSVKWALCIAQSEMRQNAADAIKRVWDYLNHTFKFGNVEVSVTTFVTGILVFVLALLISRALSTMIERRIAKRHYIDAGIRYTVSACSTSHRTSLRVSYFFSSVPFALAIA